MLGSIHGLRRTVFALSLCFLGCAGAAQVTMVSGSCSTEFERCLATCSGLTDSVECELACRFRAKQCARLQGTGGKTWLSKAPRLGGYKVLLLDLTGPKPLYSKAIDLTVGTGVIAHPRKTSGEVKGAGGFFVLEPGAHIAATYHLPAELRDAELVVTHAPGGDGTGCFITMTMGKKTLVGRYAPPRVGANRLKEESWNLTPDLAKFPVVDGKRTVKLFLYNNKTAGSTEPYRLAGIELHYRAMEKR